MIDTILNALNWRYATKKYDNTKKLSPENLSAVLESGRLSASAYGLEPWVFILVENPEVRAKIRAVGYDQPQMTDASHLLIIATRTDAEQVGKELIARAAKTAGVEESALSGYNDMVQGAISRMGDQNLSWFTHQSYIALGSMLETAALLQIDATPMEGFDPQAVNEVLGLKEKNLHASVMLALGYRGDDEFAQKLKVRKTIDEVVMRI